MIKNSEEKTKAIEKEESSKAEKESTQAINLGRSQDEKFSERESS